MNQHKHQQHQQQQQMSEASSKDHNAAATFCSNASRAATLPFLNATIS
jgi:hypothetical protein